MHKNFKCRDTTIHQATKFLKRHLKSQDLLEDEYLRLILLFKDNFKICFF